MTAYYIFGAVFALIMTLFVIMMAYRVAVLERDVARLKQAASPNHPAVKGAVRYDRL